MTNTNVPLLIPRILTSLIIVPIEVPKGPKDLYSIPACLPKTSAILLDPESSNCFEVITVVLAGTSTSRFSVLVAVTTIWSSEYSCSSSANTFVPSHITLPVMRAVINKPLEKLLFMFTHTPQKYILTTLPLPSLAWLQATKRIKQNCKLCGNIAIKKRPCFYNQQKRKLLF